MAGFALGLNRALLPWKRAGVDCLLCEESEIKGLRALCRPTPSALPRQTAPAPSVSVNSSTPVRTRVQERAGSETLRRAPVAETGRACRAPVRPPVEDTPVRSSTLVPLDRWPESWKQLLKRTVRTPLLLWSYPALRDDLSGRSSRERSNALRRLFADLQLPKGSHAFWPLAPLYGPEGPEQETGPDCDGQFFHSGVRVLRPRTVLLLCEQIPPELGLPSIGVMQSVIHNGVRFVRLHGVDSLAKDMVHRPARHTQLVQFLRTLCQ